MKIRSFNILAALFLGGLIAAGPAQSQERTVTASSSSPATEAIGSAPDAVRETAPSMVALPAAFHSASMAAHAAPSTETFVAPAVPGLAGWHSARPVSIVRTMGRQQAQAATPYVRPTAGENFRSYLYGTFGPSSYLRAAAIAGIDQAENKPPDWGQGAAGYGQRFASAFGQSLVDRTTVYGLGSLLHEDTKYYRCDCQGFGLRLKHALVTTLASRHGQDGHYVFSVPKLVAPYAGGMATLLWYPARYGPKDGFRSGNIGLAVAFGISVAREFVWSKL